MFLVIMLMASGAAPADLVLERTVKAPAAEVYAAFTTADGIRSFFAPGSNVEAKVGGPYEIYFAPEMTAGARGSDGCEVVELEPNKKLVVTWNFPPSLAALRASKAKTKVTVALLPGATGSTTVRLTQTGWQDTPDFHKGRAYFEKAWSMVLARLERRFRRAPMNWASPWVPTKPAALAFLNGRWQRSDGTYEEHWSANDAGLIGMSRSFTEGKPSFYELSTIEPEGDEVVLSIRMFEPGLKSAKKTEQAPLRLLLESASETEAQFVSESASGATVTYAHRTPDELMVRVTRTNGPREEYVFKRDTR